MFGRMKDPVEGTARLVSYYETDARGEDVKIAAQVMIEAEGVSPVSVEITPEVPRSRMPLASGTRWRVQVDRADPEKVKVLGDAGPAEATPIPAAATGVSATVVNGGTPQIQVIGNAPAEMVQQALQQAEQMMGVDLDGDGKVAGGAAPTGKSAFLDMATTWAAAQPAPAAAPATDVVSALERLADLRDQGVLTQDEFEAQKRKILGS